jgi:hypothetical protein
MSTLPPVKRWVASAAEETEMAQERMRARAATRRQPKVSDSALAAVGEKDPGVGPEKPTRRMRAPAGRYSHVYGRSKKDDE